MEKITQSYYDKSITWMHACRDLLSSEKKEWNNLRDAIHMNMSNAHHHTWLTCRAHAASMLKRRNFFSGTCMWINNWSKLIGKNHDNMSMTNRCSCVCAQVSLEKLHKHPPQEKKNQWRLNFVIRVIFDGNGIIHGEKAWVCARMPMFLCGKNDGWRVHEGQSASTPGKNCFLRRAHTLWPTDPYLMTKCDMHDHGLHAHVVTNEWTLILCSMGAGLPCASRLYSSTCTMCENEIYTDMLGSWRLRNMGEVVCRHVAQARSGIAIPAGSCV